MLETTLCGIPFKNPLIAASGVFGFGAEYGELYDVSIWGGLCTKGLTLQPKSGNSGYRIYETASGVMNSIGLQNPGVEAFVNTELPRMKKLNTRIIANLGGHSTDDYLLGIEKLDRTDVDMIELNISCPNVKSGGMAFGLQAKSAGEIVGLCRERCHKPFMVKLSPNAENIVDVALACENAGADALSLVNTFQAMAIDVKKRKPVFENTYAGLSGAAIKPLALRMVHAVCQKVSIPVVGIGGIRTAEDVIEFMMAGATAVQIGAALFSNPLLPIQMIDGLQQLMEQEKISDLSEIRGIIK
ncbi:MAG: dihydroorotate dehydrogenase [Bacteroidales bacterium]|jgi:dihydroorotate dehydrogenase (NAD+) catalytic subunit|nr:dihydroorotate dehydrogenase [Bacteroidales bacterium]MDD4395131.1 dihydroorotate dehydrogenase [Bacteroidales bacterium]